MASAIECSGSAPQVVSMGAYDVIACESGTAQAVAIPGPWYNEEVDPQKVQDFFAAVIFMMCVLIVIRMVDRAVQDN